VRFATLATLGMGASISAALTQMEFRHKKKKIIKLFGEELSAKFDKPVDALSDRDLTDIALGNTKKGIEKNGTIAEELKKSTRQRNWGVVFSVAATLASLAVVLSIVQLPTSIEHIPFADFVIKGAAGLLTYNAVKQPLHWLGEKLFNLDEDTTHDRILSMQHDREAGRQITREQILSVYASANRQLDRAVMREYGDHYDELTIEDKQKAAVELGKLIPLDNLADAVNTGKINVTELAFTVEGQMSGVEIKPGSDEMPRQKASIIDALLSKIRSAMGRGEEPAVIEVVEVPGAGPAGESATVAVAYSNPPSNFVERMGLAPVEPALGHVKQLEQRGREPAEMGGPA
jgi:hypothetical protein